MLLMPRKVKYRKSQKRKNRGIVCRGSNLRFGEYGIKSIENGVVKGQHLEACRLVMVRKLRGAGKMWVNVFPSKPVTKKPAETRMGHGKGDLDHWVCPIQRGRVIFELGGIPEDFAKIVLRLVAFKLPVKTKFVTRATQGH